MQKPWSLCDAQIQWRDGGSLDSSVRLATRWLDDCEKHGRCKVGNDAHLPTRGLDIGTKNLRRVVLREKLNQKARYICLSYCWGGTNNFLKTKSQNLQAHKTGIKLTELPLTFRDTIQIARSLRVRYLWIDSLCIQQDDPSDWEIEAGRMADVYHNAYLTIAATSARNPHEGLSRTTCQQITIDSVNAI